MGTSYERLGIKKRHKLEINELEWECDALMTWLKDNTSHADFIVKATKLNNKRFKLATLREQYDNWGLGPPQNLPHHTLSPQNTNIKNNG